MAVEYPPTLRTERFSAMPLNYDKLMSTTFEPTRQTYARRDTILYALGVGVGALDPCDAQELKYVYEKNLVALPTLAVTLAAGAMRLADPARSEEHTSELQSQSNLVCRLLLE